MSWCLIMMFTLNCHALQTLPYLFCFLGFCGRVSSYDKITVEIRLIIYIFIMKLIHFNML